MSYESITSAVLKMENLGYLLPRLLPDFKLLDHNDGRLCPYPNGYPRALVFRVENQNGRGPYVSVTSARYFKKHQASENHPSPYLSWGVGPDMDEFFGFTSLEAMLCWFDRSMDLIFLGQRGFTLRLYLAEITSVCLRSEQCMFLRSKAEFQASLELDEAWHSM